MRNPLRVRTSPQPIHAAAAKRAWHGFGFVAGLCLIAGATSAVGAESYPFEGSWILPQHACATDSVHLRTYTAREVMSSRGRCSIRRVAQGAGAFELQEECRRDGRVSTVTETIKMAPPDAMLLRRQLARLKIPRQVRYMRCSASVTAPAPARAVPHPTPTDPARRPAP